MITNILRWLRKSKAGRAPEDLEDPIILSRSQHRISRANISRAALKVLYRLHDAGFHAYLVGGGVRDLLLALHPKDFDVATDAKPEEIQALFRNCRLIGRRFRLAHVYFEGYVIEVATFRASAPKNPHKTANAQLVHSEEGMILRDNVYGTLLDDVYRRDFTVNALYYNIGDFSVIDYVGGLEDLQSRSLRMIGDARQRYREDPVRMLRAIRFAAKLNFSLHSDSAAGIFELGVLLKQVPAARLMDEYLKLFLTGFAEASVELLRKYQVFGILFPEIEQCLLEANATQVERFLIAALRETDQRVAAGKPVSLPFLLAALLWVPVLRQTQRLVSEGLSEFSALSDACDGVLNQQHKNVALSKRFMQAIREIWILQNRLTRKMGKRAPQLYMHPRFRAAYDFLQLRLSTGEHSVQEMAEWWKVYIDAEPQTRISMQSTLKGEAPRRRYRKKKY